MDGSSDADISHAWLRENLSSIIDDAIARSVDQERQRASYFRHELPSHPALDSASERTARHFAIEAATHVADDAADKAVRKMLLLINVDVHDRKQLGEIRDMLNDLRSRYVRRQALTTALRSGAIGGFFSIMASTVVLAIGWAYHALVKP